jgi:hypothetical protein
VLSSIAGGQPAHALALAELLPAIFALLGADVDLVREALFVLLNFGEKGPEFCDILHQLSIVPGPSAFMIKKNKDRKRNKAVFFVVFVIVDAVFLVFLFFFSFLFFLFYFLFFSFSFPTQPC